MLVNLAQLPNRTGGVVRRFMARASAVFLGCTTLSIGIALTSSVLLEGANLSSRDVSGIETIRDDVARTRDRLARLRSTFNARNDRMEAFKFPRRLLDELGAVTPDGVQLERVSLRDEIIEIDGESLTERGVDDVMIKLSSAVSLSDPMPVLVRGSELASNERKKFSITAKVNKAKRDS